MAALLDQPAAPGEGEPLDDEDIDLSERPSIRVRRDADLLGRRGSPIRRWLTERFEHIVKGFEDQRARSDALDKYWNCYNCELDDNQFYNGNAEVYVPILRDAVNARTTRFANQLFPQGGRNVEVTSADGQQPFEIIALIDRYLKDNKVKSRVVKPLLRNGDIEGQYNLCIDWMELRRQIVSRQTRGHMLPDGTDLEGDEIVDIKEEDIVEGRPVFEVLHDADVLVLPATADSVEEALELGGSVTIVRRWSKDKTRAMLSDGEIDDVDVDAGNVTPTLSGLNDMEKKLARDVGVRVGGKHLVFFEVWQNVPLNENGAFSEKKGTMRLCRTWYAIDRAPKGCRRNPYWNDRCPLLSAPVEKISGVFKGKSLVEPLTPLQYEANDAANERADADHYGAMPIIARKPGEGNAPLILNLAAVWDVDPNDVKFMAFPDLSARANARILAATQVIFQSLGVNPAMLPQTGRAGQKRNQAEVALEQQVDLLTTAEAVTVVTESILDDAVAWCVDLDHQFRDREITVRAYGELGVRAEMIEVPPLMNRTAYSFQWVGAEQAKLNVAMQQQGTAFLNIARGMRQDLAAEGFQLRLGPLFERLAGAVFGAVYGPQVLVDMRRQMTIDPDVENQLMAAAHQVGVHPLDDDQKHILSHQQYVQAEGGDPHGNFMLHIQEHLKQRQMKMQAQMAAMMQQQQGAPGVPGGAGRGVAGTPRLAGTPPGAVPAGPRLLKGPPGMIRPDNAPGAGALTMPRRM